MLAQQGEFKKSEAVKLFHLIQQTVPSTHILTAQTLKQFLVLIKSDLASSANILQHINPYGKQMTSDHFGSCLSLYFEEKVSGYTSFLGFNRGIYTLLNSQEYIPEKKQFKGAIDLLKPPIYDDGQDLKNYKQLVESFNMDLKYRQQYSNFSEILKKINYCLASLYYDNDLFQEVCRDTKVYISNEVLEKVFELIGNQNFQEDIFKYLNYVVEALKFASVKEMTFRTILFDKINWNYLMNVFQQLCQREDSATQKILLAAFLASFSTISSDFTNYLQDWLQRNAAVAGSFILSPLKSVTQPVFIRYVIQIYYQIINRITADSTNNNYKVYEYIEQFALRVLTTGSIETCEPAIQLISQTVKFSLGNYLGERDITVIVKALQATESGLISATLQVFENALKCNNEQVIEMFTRKKKCMEFIKFSLQQPFCADSVSLHCQCLQIIFHLVKPQLLSLFEEYNLIETLFQTINTSSYFFTFTSCIFAKLARESCRQQKTANLMKDRKALQLILSLLLGSYGQDFVMDSFLNGYRFAYFNKQILVNCFSCLYVLNRKIANTTYKLFQKDKSMELGLKIIDFAIKFMGLCKQNQFLKRTLREELKLQGFESVRVYKLIFSVCEQVLFCAKEASKEVQRELFKFRNILMFELYELLTYAQLQSENIPIFIHFQINVVLEEEQEHNFVRFLPAKYNYQSLKYYIMGLMRDTCKSIGYSITISDIFINVKNMNCEIRNEIEYRKLISRLIKNHPHNYHLNIKVQVQSSSLNSQNSTFYSQLSPYRPSNRDNYTSRSSVNYANRINETVNMGSQNTRSISPFRGTSSAIFSNLNGNGNICESCGKRNPANQRFCLQCNRR